MKKTLDLLKKEFDIYYNFLSTGNVVYKNKKLFTEYLSVVKSFLESENVDYLDDIEILELCLINSRFKYYNEENYKNDLSVRFWLSYNNRQSSEVNSDCKTIDTLYIYTELINKVFKTKIDLECISNFLISNMFNKDNSLSKKGNFIYNTFIKLNISSYSYTNFVLLNLNDIFSKLYDLFELKYPLINLILKKLMENNTILFHDESNYNLRHDLLTENNIIGISDHRHWGRSANKYTELIINKISLNTITHRQNNKEIINSNIIIVNYLIYLIKFKNYKVTIPENFIKEKGYSDRYPYIIDKPCFMLQHCLEQDSFDSFLDFNILAYKNNIIYKEDIHTILLSAFNQIKKVIEDYNINNVVTLDSSYIVSSKDILKLKFTKASIEILLKDLFNDNQF